MEEKKINLITRDCTGGFIYEQMGTQYINPFIWTNMTVDNYCILIENYDTLNFQKIEPIINQTIYKDIIPNNCFVPQLVIDDKLIINYPHHLYCNDIDTPQKVDFNRLASKNMLDVIKERYLRQLKRMTDNKIQPLFIFSDYIYNRGEDITMEDVNKVLNAKRNPEYKMILASKLNIDTNNINVPYINNNNFPTLNDNIKGLKNFILNDIY